MIINNSILSDLNFVERRLINYLMCRKGKPGQMLRNQGDKPLRLNALIRLVNLGILKIVNKTGSVIYFNFTTPQTLCRLSISFGQFITSKPQ
jgi:hypothetical protein